MLMCFVNRNTKELLVTLEAENCPQFIGNNINEEYDAIRFENAKLENLITEKDGKTYLNFEYSE